MYSCLFTFSTLCFRFDCCLFTFQFLVFVFDCCLFTFQLFVFVLTAVYFQFSTTVFGRCRYGRVVIPRETRKRNLSTAMTPRLNSSPQDMPDDESGGADTKSILSITKAAEDSLDAVVLNHFEFIFLWFILKIICRLNT